MDTLLQDLRFAARSLTQRPGFTLVAVLTLGVGIGANAAIFSVVDATLLRRLPFREPERLMVVSLTTPPRRGLPGSTDMAWSYPKFRTFRDQQQVFEEVALYSSAAFSLTGVDQADRVPGEVVGARYLRLLGISAIRGRTFLDEEDSTPEARMVAVISHELWQRHFGGDTAIVGRSISLDARAFTVVGVLPPGVRGLTGSAQIWLPVMTRSASELNEAFSHSYSLIARLRSGVTLAQAQAGVITLGRRVDEAHPLPDADAGGGHWGAIARPLNATRIDPTVRRVVVVLFGAVALVLLIACVNIANLFLARATARRREIGVRLALGASRGRLIRQMLTESTLLAIVSGAVGVILAWWGVKLLAAINPASSGAFGRRVSGLAEIGFSSIRIDGSVLGFTLAVAMLSGILFGIVPALQSSRTGVTEALKLGGAPTLGFGGVRALTSRTILVVTEVALALVLLIASGLMIKSLARLLGTDAGFDAENVLTMRVSLPLAMYPRDSTTAFFDDLLPRIAALPAVESVALGNCPPLAGGCNGTLMWFANVPAPGADRRPPPGSARRSPPLAPSDAVPVGVHFVSPDYFRTMHVPVLRGRGFTTTDRRDAPKVVLINETAAKKFWPREDPIGRRVGVGQGGFGDGAEIVGVVGDVRFGTMDSLPVPDVFISYLQAPRNAAMLFVRTAQEPAALAGAVRRAVQAVDPNIPLFDVRTMDDRVGLAIWKTRFSATLLGVFAAVALALAALGIYGVMAFAVTQRTRELGIRIALGAVPGSVLRLVVKEGLALALAGVAIGLAGAWVSTRVLTSLLYEVAPSDPATYALIAVVLSGVAVVASLIPALRATRVDPLVALRTE